jgi:hypothetical protein
MTGIIVPDGGNIGSASDTDAISISSSGAVTLSSDFVPATPLSHRNALINGNFTVWQRGSTFNSSASQIHYSADRWAYYNYQQGSATAVTRQEFTIGQTDVPSEPTYYLRHTLGSSNQEWWFFQRIEDVKTLAGQTATLSLWMKSSSAQTVRLRLHQNFGSGGSTTVYSSTTDCSVTTSWTKFTATITPASISGKTIGTSNYLSVDIGSLGATAVASSTVDIAQVQLEKGSVATPYEHRSFPDELRRCQRYYERTYPYGTATGSGSSSSAAYAGALFAGLNGTGGQTTGWIHAQFRDQVEKRATPTTTMYDTAGNVGKLSLTVPGTSTTHDKTAGTGDVSTNSISIFRSSGTSDSASSFYCHLLRDAEFN